MNESFKERVCRTAIDNAPLFKSNLIDYEYCIFSEGLSTKYVIVKALDSNYLHLVGVNTNLPADVFFKKCLNKSLTVDDFDFMKRGVSSKSLKGTVRDKIKVLDKMVNILFFADLKICENFEHNKIRCAFASANNDCTLGFAESGHPKSLLRGDYLGDNSLTVDLIVRRANGDEKPFSEIIFGNISNIQKYKDMVVSVLSEDML